MGKKENKEYFAKLLIFIGGIMAIVAGALTMATLNLMAILIGLLVLLLGLAAVMSAIKPGKPIPCNIVVEIPIGAVIIFLTWLGWLGFIAGLLIVIGGIFLAIDFK